MDEIKAKQQVVEKIKEASKILVTVSDNPSVDALSAALGLTLLLDKQEKYATAIFSGETPPAIAFLEPQKTFDDTTDSLRDFIIALNKEKADHLRYKVEGDAVKIFITPYKTTITQDDLEFSQGDYNVELVVAIGVDSQANLDEALDNHGQILHDAAIVTLTAGDQTSELGGVDWHDADASSLSEMVAGLAEALKDDKKKPLIDTQIATALLTGIVAETDRFSNEHTTSKVMTVAATLMAAGADQQLIATELQQSRLVQAAPADKNEDLETATDLDDDESVAKPPKDATRLTIDHDETLAELDERIRGEEAAQEKIEEEIEAAEEAAEEVAGVREEAEVAKSKPTSVAAHKEAPAPSTQLASAYALDDDPSEEPTFGGTLNATTDQAEDDARRAAEEDQNKTILSHAYIGDPSAADAPTSLTSEPAGFPGTPPAAPGSESFSEVPESESVHSAYALDEEPQANEGPSIALGGERVIEPLAHNEPAVAPSVNSVPAEQSAYAPPVQAAAPADLGLPLPPPIPDFSQGLAAAIPSGTPSQTGILGDILAPEAPQADPSQQYMDYETTNTVAAPGSAYAVDDASSLPPLDAVAPAAPPAPFVDQTPPAPQVPPAAPATPAPGQFQIPGQ